MENVVLLDKEEGIALFKNAQRVRQRTYQIPSMQTERKRRKVALLEDGSGLMSGSDHGLVYIFNRRTGRIDQLQVGGTGEWVQSMEVSLFHQW